MEANTLSEASYAPTHTPPRVVSFHVERQRPTFIPFTSPAA